MPVEESSAFTTVHGRKFSSKKAATSRSGASAASVSAPAHAPFHASCFASTVQLLRNASSAGCSASRPQLGSSCQVAATRWPRYSTGGAGGVGGVGAVGGGGHTGFSAGGHASGSTFGASAAQPARNATTPTHAAMADNVGLQPNGAERGLGVPRNPRGAGDRGSDRVVDVSEETPRRGKRALSIPSGGCAARSA